MLPHYRKNEWSFQRGAAATVDRNFLGWQGRFFLHDGKHEAIRLHIKSDHILYSSRSLPRHPPLLPSNALLPRTRGYPVP